jgi:aryl-alcohol dehydrogenase-like predicted oxidoreductase
VNKEPKSYLNYNAEEVAKAAAAIKKVSSQKRNSAQTAIQFVLQNAAITSAVVGIRTIDQLNDAVNALNEPWLNEDEMKILRETIPLNYYSGHR